MPKYAARVKNNKERFSPSKTKPKPTVDTRNSEYVNQLKDKMERKVNKNLYGSGSDSD